MMKISVFNRKHLLTILVAANLLLAALYLLTNHILTLSSWSLVNWFDLNAEANIPTWFSSAQLLLLSILAAAVAVIYRRLDIDKYQARLFTVMAVAFLFFSMDETAVIHEAVSVMAQRLEAYLPATVCHAMWVCVYAVTALIVALVCARGMLAFLRDKTGRSVFILGGLVFVCGGVLIDEAARLYANSVEVLPVWMPPIVITLEESLEALGETLMIFALMTKIDATGVSLDNLFRRPEEKPLEETARDEELVEG